MRCFIAIEFPDHVRSRIFHETEIIRNKDLIRGNFIGKENLHLTLKFLGEIDKGQLDSVIKRLKEIEFNSFLCEVGKIEFFGENNVPRVLWIEIISNNLKKIQQQISKKLSEFPEDHKFTPHLTLARIKSVQSKDKLSEEIKKTKLKKLDFKIDEFVIIKSELFPSGSKYKVIERFPLK